MKKSFLLFPLIGFLFACGGETENSTQKQSQITEVDTVFHLDSTNVEQPVSYEIDLEALFAKVQYNNQDIANIDSAYIAETSEEAMDYALSGDEARMLISNVAEGNLCENNTYQVDYFLQFDSLKAIGKYQDYLDSLDIGMMAHSEAYAIQIMNLTEDSKLFVWAVDYGTYEACPYGYGTTIYGSLFTDDIFKNTVLIGDISGGADAPYWGSTLITSTISADKITYYELQEEGGEEENEEGEYVEVVTSTEHEHTAEIVDGFFKITHSTYEN
jgi:hypothetical protein